MRVAVIVLLGACTAQPDDAAFEARPVTFIRAHKLQHVLESPGCKLAFYSTRDRNHGIFVINSDGTVSRLTTGLEPTWSWDDTRRAT